MALKFQGGQATKLMDPSKQRVYDQARALFQQLERLNLPLMVKGKLAEASQELKSIAMNDGVKVGPPGML